MQLGGVPRVPLGLFPTPLHELERLSAHLGGPRIWIKRDDLTGLGLGGNKLRKLEYAMAEAQSLGATVIVTIGGPQSNHVRLTTACANRLGLRTILVLRGEEPDAPTGNLLVDRILGPKEIHFVEPAGYPPKGEEDRVADETVAGIVERLRKEGEVPYVIPNGCRPLHGALGYAGCVLETISQLRERGLEARAAVAAVGTSSTLTGLILGSHLYAQSELEVIGISVATDAAALRERVTRQLIEAAEFLHLAPAPAANSFDVLDDYVGPAYGVPTKAMRDAILLVARTEGIVLDPVYTGKAMAGLIDLVRKRRFRKDACVVFLHTGGTPGLFAADQAPMFDGI
jgi:D-cysteine desulfhydrase family pyridoxal phosphate-dependent enzyme